MSVFSKILNAPISTWFPLRRWNEEYDIWSLLSDFFFLFGVFVLDWNPILLIAYFMIDTATMSLFAIILFYKERNDWIHSFGFIFIVFLMLVFMLAIYNSVLQYIDDLAKLDIPTQAIDPTHLFNPVVIPLVLCFSALTHYAEYESDLQRMKLGTYNSSFIKHFILRYFMINGLVLLMVFSFVFYNLTVIVGLLAVKSILRLINKKYRKIL